MPRQNVNPDALSESVKFMEKYLLLLKYFPKAPDFLPRTSTLILYSNSVTNQRFGESFKDLIVETWKKYNVYHPQSKINKGELYAMLFAMGMPMGFIAKLLLNGNLAPIRNAVILHKTSIAFIINAKIRLDSQNSHDLFAFAKLYSISSMSRSLQTQIFMMSNLDIKDHLIFNIIKIANDYGGIRLMNKFKEQTDLIAFIRAYRDEIISNNLVNQNLFENYERNAHRLNFFADSNMATTANDIAQANNAIALYTNQGASSRGRRTTGLTTSRNAQAVANGQQLPTAQTPAEQGATVTSAAVSNTQVNNTAPRQVPVRDIPFTNTLGVEIELALPHGMSLDEFDKQCYDELIKAGLKATKYGVDKKPGHWAVTRDGSIYPNGREIVSPILTGVDGIEDLRKAIVALRNTGGSINSSVGIHVHMGAQGLSLDQTKNVVYNYHGFQDLINKFLHNTRTNNGYAQPMTRISNIVSKLDSANNLNELTRNLFGATIESRRYERYPSERYWAVNFYSYLRYGTIEFRQLQGSLEEDTIIYWIYFLHFMWEASKRKRLSFFDYKQLRNITPVWLSTWLGNRSFDLHDKNFNSANR